jgi:hypothetical protein
MNVLEELTHFAIGRVEEQRCLDRNALSLRQLQHWKFDSVRELMPMPRRHDAVRPNAAVFRAGTGL